MVPETAGIASNQKYMGRSMMSALKEVAELKAAVAALKEILPAGEERYYSVLPVDVRGNRSSF